MTDTCQNIKDADLDHAIVKLHLHAQEFTRILEEMTLFQVFLAIVSKRV